MQKNTQDSQPVQPVDPESVRQAVKQAFLGGPEPWGDPRVIVQQLEPWLDLGERYVAAGEWLHAATIYTVLAQEVLAHELAILQDERGTLHGMIWHCTVELGRCLQATTDTAEREKMLRTLFEVYAWNLDAGGLGLADIVPDIFCEHTTTEERRQIAAWIQSQLPAGEAWQDQYRRQAWGTLWLNLESEWLDDEAFLEVCLQTGLLLPLVERLLQLGRVEDAAGEARRASDLELLSLAELFIAHGEAALAENLVRERAQTSSEDRLRKWLEARHNK